MLNKLLRRLTRDDKPKTSVWSRLGRDFKKKDTTTTAPMTMASVVSGSLTKPLSTYTESTLLSSVYDRRLDELDDEAQSTPVTGTPHSELDDEGPSQGTPVTGTPHSESTPAESEVVDSEDGMTVGDTVETTDDETIDP